MVPVQAESNVSFAAASTGRGNPGDCFGFGSGSDSGSGDASGSNSGSSAGPSLSTGLSSPDPGGGAAPGDPQSAGESGPGASDGIRLESRVHAAAPCPQLLPNRGIDDILEDQVEPEGESRTPRFEERGDAVQGSGFLGLREEWSGDLDSWKGQIES